MQHAHSYVQLYVCIFIYVFLRTCICINVLSYLPLASSGPVVSRKLCLEWRMSSSRASLPCPWWSCWTKRSCMAQLWDLDRLLHEVIYTYIYIYISYIYISVYTITCDTLCVCKMGYANFIGYFIVTSCTYIYIYISSMPACRYHYQGSTHKNPLSCTRSWILHVEWIWMDAFYWHRDGTNNGNNYWVMYEWIIFHSYVK